MEYLIKIGNNVEFRNQHLIYVNSEKLDEQSIHINFETQTNLFFACDTDLNGVVYLNSDELIDALNKK
jgi:hypothetical protein